MARKNTIDTPVNTDWQVDAASKKIVWPEGGVLIMWRALEPIQQAHHHCSIPFTVNFPGPVVFERRNGFQGHMSDLFLNKQDAVASMLISLADIRREYIEHFDWMEEQLRDG